MKRSTYCVALSSLRKLKTLNEDWGIEETHSFYQPQLLPVLFNYFGRAALVSQIWYPPYDLEQFIFCLFWSMKKRKIEQGSEQFQRANTSDTEYWNVGGVFIFHFQVPVEAENVIIFLHFDVIEKRLKWPLSVPGNHLLHFMLTTFQQRSPL